MDGWLAFLSVVVAVVAIVLAAVAIGLRIRDDRTRTDIPASARVLGLERRVDQLGQRLEVLERDVDGLDRVPAGVDHPTAASRSSNRDVGWRFGLVRFDAFEDAGGAQSFALALIDAGGDGVVLTSLHARQSSRLYVKDIRGGVGDAPLSDEEVRALREAGVTS